MFTVFGELLRPHICMEFQHVTTDKFNYFIVTSMFIYILGFDL
jgi:hypothetical protein